MCNDEKIVPCVFCQAAVTTHCEGFAGMMIGERAICSGCLEELRDALNTA